MGATYSTPYNNNVILIVIGALVIIAIIIILISIFSSGGSPPPPPPNNDIEINTTNKTNNAINTNASNTPPSLLSEMAKVSHAREVISVNPQPINIQTNQENQTNQFTQLNQGYQTNHTKSMSIPPPIMDVKSTYIAERGYMDADIQSRKTPDVNTFDTDVQQPTFDTDVQQPVGNKKGYRESSDDMVGSSELRQMNSDPFQFKIEPATDPFTDDSSLLQLSSSGKSSPKISSSTMLSKDESKGSTSNLSNGSSLKLSNHSSKNSSKTFDTQSSSSLGIYDSQLSLNPSPKEHRTDFSSEKNSAWKTVEADKYPRLKNVESSSSLSTDQPEKRTHRRTTNMKKSSNPTIDTSSIQTHSSLFTADTTGDTVNESEYDSDDVTNPQSLSSDFTVRSENGQLNYLNAIGESFRRKTKI